jgi:acyl carrier protein
MTRMPTQTSPGTDVESTALDLLREIAVDAPGELGRDTGVKDAGISSLDLVELIFALEEKYDIEIPYNANTSDSQFKTLGDMIAVVERLVAEKSRAEAAAPRPAST